MELTEKAQKVLDKYNEIGGDIQEDEELIEIMQEWSCSDGLEYGLIDGGLCKTRRCFKRKIVRRFSKCS